jgi:hypothetical protein
MVGAKNMASSSGCAVTTRAVLTLFSPLGETGKRASSSKSRSGLYDRKNKARRRTVHFKSQSRLGILGSRGRFGGCWNRRVHAGAADGFCGLTLDFDLPAIMWSSMDPV